MNPTASPARPGRFRATARRRPISCRPCLRFTALLGAAAAALMTLLAPPADAADPRGNAADPSASDAVIFSSDFNGEAWHRGLHTDQRGDRLRIVTEDPERKFKPLDGPALRIAVPKGEHYGTSIQYRFKEQLGEESESIYFRYYLRLGDDWNPKRGGKLPGIAGTYGEAGWGGRPARGDDGWSARGLFRGRENGRTPVGFYCYHADMTGKYGSGWVWDREQRGYLENNRWYCIEQHVRLNTPGENDGVLRAWVDGRLAFEKTDVRFRDVKRLKIETIWLNIYHGGRWTAESDHHLYIDDVVISREPIGPRHKE